MRSIAWGRAVVAKRDRAARRPGWMREISRRTISVALRATPPLWSHAVKLGPAGLARTRGVYLRPFLSSRAFRATVQGAGVSGLFCLSTDSPPTLKSSKLMPSNASSRPRDLPRSRRLLWGTAGSALVAAGAYAAWAFRSPGESHVVAAAQASSAPHRPEQGTVLVPEVLVPESGAGAALGSRSNVAAPEAERSASSIEGERPEVEAASPGASPRDSRNVGEVGALQAEHVSGTASASGDAPLPSGLTRRVLSEAFQHPTDPPPTPAADDPRRMPAFAGNGKESEAALGKYIQGVVRREMAPLAYSCLAVRFEEDPSIEETVEIRLVVSGDGKVGGVVLEAKLTERSTLTDAAEIECIEQSALTLAFAAPPKGHQNITIVYPMVLSSRWIHQRAQERQNAESAR